MRPKHKPKPNATRQVYHSEFLPLEWSLVPERGASSAFAKVLVDKATDRVLGLHFCGPNAGEVIQGYAAAMKVSMRACVCSLVWCCVLGRLVCVRMRLVQGEEWLERLADPHTHISLHPYTHRSGSPTRSSWAPWGSTPPRPKSW